MESVTFPKAACYEQRVALHQMAYLYEELHALLKLIPSFSYPENPAWGSALRNTNMPCLQRVPGISLRVSVKLLGCFPYSWPGLSLLAKA
jgi:hypothetical protein